MTQWVCKTCGYNMTGEQPDICPFCGAHHDQFISGELAEKTYRVTAHRVNDSITQLVSEPKLGLEHAAYRIETEKGSAWIDCPSVFNRTLEPSSTILFTHLHFMGASNQYRETWNAKVFLHVLDADQPLSRPFSVDERFKNDFAFNGITAYHIGGHTPGFTIYIYQDVLFICDYAFPPGMEMRLNPHGPQHETLDGAKHILSIIGRLSLTTVCGYNYICDFKDWFRDFKRVINSYN